MNEKEKPLIEEESEKKSGRKLFFIVLAIVIVAIAAFLLIRGIPGDKDSPESKIQQMEEMVNQVNKLETDIKEKQNEVFSLITQYKTKTGQNLPSVNILNLSDEEKNLLEKKIREEQDVSIKSLLNDIIEKNTEIEDLTEKLKEVESLLPKPHIVTSGENHYQISMDFLVNEKGLEKEKALELIERSLLLDNLIPGFKVWNFYSGDEYGTFVTQGDAAISPNTIVRRAKKKLVDERDKAISERDNLSSEISILEKKREELLGQLDYLNQEKQQLINKLTDLNNQNLSLQKDLNSIFYLVDTRASLKNRGILKSSFLAGLKLANYSDDDFNLAADLRSTKEIEISAEALKLERIRRVTIYPKIYKRGNDYTVLIKENGISATVTILNIDKFKNERVVMSVE